MNEECVNLYKQFYLSYSFIIGTVFFICFCDCERLRIRYGIYWHAVITYIYYYTYTCCVLYNHVKMTYTAAKTNVIEGSIIKNTRVTDRVDFSLIFGKTGQKMYIYMLMYAYNTSIECHEIYVPKRVDT